MFCRLANKNKIKLFALLLLGLMLMLSQKWYVTKSFTKLCKLQTYDEHSILCDLSVQRYVTDLIFPNVLKDISIFFIRIFC